MLKMTDASAALHTAVRTFRPDIRPVGWEPAGNGGARVYYTVPAQCADVYHETFTAEQIARAAAQVHA